MAKYNKNRYGSIVLTDDKGNNFTITRKEQAELKKFTKRANQRRYDKTDKYYNMVKNQQNMKGISKEAYRNLLESKGFITEKYSSAFNQFKSKNDFKEYMKELKGVTKRGYGDNRIKEIRESMIKRVNEQYGEIGNNLKELLSNINDGALISLYTHNDELIQEIYYNDVNEDILLEQVTKTESDINIALMEYKKNKK